MMSIPVFMLCKKVQIHSEMVRKALANLTVCGFGVYMIHYFFTGPGVLLARACQIPVSLQIIFGALFAFAVSWVLVALLRRVAGRYARIIFG